MSKVKKTPEFKSEAEERTFWGKATTRQGTLTGSRPNARSRRAFCVVLPAIDMW